MDARNGTSATWALLNATNTMNSTNTTNATVFDDGWVRGDSALPRRRRANNPGGYGTPCFACICGDGCNGMLLIAKCQNLEVGYSGYCYVMTFFAALALFPAVLLAGVAGMLGYKAGHDQASKR